MSEVRIGGSTRAGTVQQDASSQGAASSAFGGPPQLPMGELGIAGMVAMLVASNASANARAARELQQAEGDAQAAAIERQVAALREKAADTRAEGVVSGALIAAGGAVTVSSLAAMPSPSTPSARIDSMKAQSEVIRSSGNTIGQLGTPIAHATYGAAREAAEADATKAAASAKFHETAKDEYASLAKEAKGTADKVNQFLQSVLAEKQMAMRGILKMA